MVFAVLLATVAAAAEQDASPEAETRRTFVGLVPISLGSGLIAIDTEHAVGPRLTIRTGVRIGAGLAASRGTAGFSEGNNSHLSAGLEPGIRYYLTGTALDGVWIGPHLELSYAQHNALSLIEAVEFESGSQTWRAGAGALMGYSMVVARGLTVQAGVGLGVAYSSGRTTMEDTLNPEQPKATVFRSRGWEFAERATLAVGWSF
jgi:hypothetical protein